MSAYNQITAAELKKKLDADQEARLVDVRVEKDYKKGHIKGAINIPFDQADKFGELDKTKSYYLYCRVGGKSAMTTHYLNTIGFENVHCVKSTFEKLQKTLQA